MKLAVALASPSANKLQTSLVKAYLAGDETSLVSLDHIPGF